MKKIVFIIFILVIGSSIWGQKAKKPKIMVIPSDLWYKDHHFMTEYEDQGQMIAVPNYMKAFRENKELLPVIGKINELMAERGFPLKDLESVLKSLQLRTAKNIVRKSSRTGSKASESPLDMIKARAKPDIVMQLTWTINTEGPKKSITYVLKGLDAYTNKQVAYADGTGSPSFSTILPVLLEEAVLSNMDTFCNTLQRHFEDMFASGREIVVEVQCWDDWDNDMYSEFGDNGDELSLLIEDWFADNTVGGVFSADSGDKVMYLEEVRIPLFYERNGKQRAMAAKDFGNQLRKYLRDNYGIESKVETEGLGKVIVVLGHK